VDVVGRRALGIAYPLRWHYGARTDEVMTLGIANRRGTRAMPLPGEFIPLAVAADDNRTLPPELADRTYKLHAQRARHTFKFEPRSDYPDMHDLVPSLAAWLVGDRAAARGLMDKEKVPGAYCYPIEGRDRIRVRVIDDALTPFTEWELELFARVHVPTFGDTIYLLPRAALTRTDVPSGDVVIFDDRCGYVNGYDDAHDGTLQYRTLVDADHGDRIDDLIQLEERLMQLAATHGRRLEPSD